MPAVSRSTTRAQRQRTAPYPPRQPSTSDTDKENASPQAAPPKAKVTKKKSAKESEPSDRPGSYHDIELDEVKGEVPCHESAAQIRRKLNILIEKKTPIPGTTKTFNRTTLSKELTTIAENHHPIKSHNGVDAHGPSAASVSRFLKKTGEMGGGDSEVYYYGNMLLEKLRIYKGEKKTKAREKAEQEYPNGRMRVDPATLRIWCKPDERISQADVAKWSR